MSETPTTRSPTVWRRWLALELRRLRAETGLTTQQVAERMSFSKGRLSFLETATRPARPDDLEQLLPLYGVPEDRWEAYFQAARDAKARGWWERYDSHTLPEWLSLYVGLEQGATKMSLYEPTVVHGLFQTPDYTAAMMRRGMTPRTEDQVQRQVQIRAQRQAVLDREDPPSVWLVVGEGVLRNVIGDRTTMAAQLRHLAERAELPQVTVQVIPFEHGNYVGTGPFAVLDFGWANDPGLVYVEYRGGNLYPDGERIVDDHKLWFQRSCAQALPPVESLAFIRSCAKEHASP